VIFVVRTPNVRDLYCTGSEDIADRLRARGWTIVSLHDGWYPDQGGGGVAVWGNGRYWEVRESPLHVVAQG